MPPLCKSPCVRCQKIITLEKGVWGTCPHCGQYNIDDLRITLIDNINLNPSLFYSKIRLELIKVDFQQVKNLLDNKECYSSLTYQTKKLVKERYKVELSTRYCSECGNHIKEILIGEENGIYIDIHDGELVFFLFSFRGKEIC